jgi:FHS family L-fucose permease-like MFS transporter
MALFLNSDLVWGRSDALFDLPFVTLVVPQDNVPGLSLEQAGKATALYWGGAMIGRFLGSALLTRVPAPRLLALFTATAGALCLFVVAAGGVPGGWAALSIGLFNSIMFPVIFTITLERSSVADEPTSGFLCFSIVGGAIIPLLVGLVSQHSSYVAAFIVPALCYAVILLFAIASWRARPGGSSARSAATIH